MVFARLTKAQHHPRIKTMTACMMINKLKLPLSWCKHIMFRGLEPLTSSW